MLKTTQSPVVHAGVFIGVGSRHEEGDEEGIAHFIEHCLFKGTQRRRSWHIRNRIDGVGGELDAFTSKEETCLYASALSQHLERCLELFADVLFHSVFPQHEIEKEKEVVLEEINLYKDSPSELIYDDFEERLFAGHPLAHNILGSRKNVRHFTSAQLSAFMARHYTPDRLVISVVGNVDPQRLVRLCQKHFTALPTTTSPQPASPPLSVLHSPLPDPLSPLSTLRSPLSTLHSPLSTPTTPFHEVLHKRTHQVHLLMGCPAPCLTDPNKTAFTLLCNLLGGPALNSRLNVAVREKQGIAYTVESQYVPFSDAGVFYIYADAHPASAEQCTKLILSELEHIRNQRLSPRRLHAAQQQLIGQMAVASDSGQNEMQSIGKACLNYGRADTLEEMSRDVMSVTAHDLQALANTYLTDQRLCSLSYIR